MVKGGLAAILLLLLFCIQGYGQAVYNKVGGVCFRVDDHQAAYKWRDFNAVFNKYGYKFSLGVDAQRIWADTAAQNALKEVAAAGHELMDHTPSGTMAYINYASNMKKDTLYFYGKPGVHHINTSISRICLEIDTVYTENVTGEGLVNMYGNIIISQNPGEFKDMQSPVFLSNLYFPTKDIVASWTNLQNKNQSDPDTLKINSYWQEALNLDTVLGIPYHKMSGYDVKMTEDALKLLVERSLFVFDSLDLPRPHTWIQPGGSFAQLTKQEVKDFMAAKYGYTAAATYQGASFKMYNEVDSLYNKRFAVQNPDINDETNSLQTLINTISDNSARHLHSFTLGHFVTPGGWTDYIAKIDSLLMWCRDNNIPVRTVNEWASIMFDSVPNPYANTIPELYRDLNKNGIPDGYVAPFGTFDSTDGVARSQGRSIMRTTSGSFFAINILGGVEKGWNRLSLYTKGTAATDSVRVSISLPEIPGSNKFYNLAANTADWQEVSTMVYIDPRASRMNFQVNALRPVSTGSVHISGVQLRKLSSIKVNTGYKQEIITTGFFDTINISQLVIDSVYNPAEYKATVSAANALQVKYDSITGILTVKKPSLFWVGKDSLKVVASNNDKTSDSAYIHFEAASPSICEGNSITLKSHPAYGTNFKWYDGSNVIQADSIVVSPTVSSWYKVEYTDLTTATVTDSIFITVDTQKPTITFTNDTIICHGSNAAFTLPDAGNISWYDENNALLTSGSSLQLNNITANRKLYIKNNINTCSSRDSVSITVRPTKIATQPVRSEQTIKEVKVGFNLVVPSYVSVSLISLPQNTFIYQNDSIIFTPLPGFTGVDSAYFVLTDSLCATDTVLFRVTVSVGASVKENALGNVKIYPNPAKTELHIVMEQQGEVSIYNLLGQAVLKQPLASGENELNISGFAQGMYTLWLLIDDKVITQLIVKE